MAPFGKERGLSRRTAPSGAERLLFGWAQGQPGAHSRLQRINRCPVNKSRVNEYALQKLRMTRIGASLTLLENPVDVFALDVLVAGATPEGVVLAVYIPDLPLPRPDGATLSGRFKQPSSAHCAHAADAAIAVTCAVVLRLLSGVACALTIFQITPSMGFGRCGQQTRARDGQRRQ
jgi:hypothetical protein